RFNLEEGKVSVDELELAQGSQLVKVNGLISDQEDDILTINFQDFSLETFNPLSKSAGIEMSGLMNGDFEIRSLLKHLFIQSDIQAKGIQFNQTAIGDLSLKAGFDQTSKLVNLTAEVKNKGRRSFFVNGTYNAMLEENNLDLELRLNNSPIILFQPFLQKLVANLSGSASADLIVSGTPFRPVINGRAKLDNAGFIVNYLRTPYLIDDEIQIKNSVITLD